MQNNEKQDNNLLPEGNSRQIQVMLNQPEDNEETIDLGRVFRNFKQKRRLYAWVLILCMTVGVCTPLLMYQFTKTPLTVSSVVTLRYEKPVLVQKTVNGKTEWVIPEDPEYKPVSDLSAPDGKPLDLSQITSAYVLQTALNRLTLSAPITASQLAMNISIRTLLTDESRRIKESLEGLAEAKNTDAYKQLQDAEMTYQNRFVVTLTNGFGSEDSKNKVELQSNELSQLLDQVLTAYNLYLVRTYADIKLPGDAFSIIDTENLDIMDSLDQIQTGLQDLYDYCNEKTDMVKEYRSWRTGHTLQDWMEMLDTFRRGNVDYLYAMVEENAVTRDKVALLNSWKYLLQQAKNELEETNENIAETKRILATYKNDEVFISMQENDVAKYALSVSDYYDDLILKQTKLYDQAAKLNTKILNYEERIKKFETAKATEVTPEIEEELARCAAEAQSLYSDIRDHMSEVFQSSLYTTYEDHSAAQGREQSFLAASTKNMIIGGVAGAVIALAIWFLAALAPEFSKKEKIDEKEGAAK